jgi:multiple antibiotic resistance protein
MHEWCSRQGTPLRRAPLFVGEPILKAPPGRSLAACPWDNRKAVKPLSLVLEFIPLGFSALLPVLNPIGSAVLFLGFVPNVDHATRKHLARRIAINTIWFLFIVQIIGAYVLRFFGISLPVVQVAGGLVLASMGWSLLTRPDEDTTKSAAITESPASLEDRIFYPLTFPITAGPGCIVVALTLSAHASESRLVDSAFAHLGLLIATVLLGLVVYFSYAYADRTAARLSPAAAQGILRVISFILLCIGGEIMWNGIQHLMKAIS